MPAAKLQTRPPQIAMLAIGNELLVGSTRDINVLELGRRAVQWGLAFQEARILRDDKPAIIQSVRALSTKYDYVVTSGGIGPTHDDITAAAIGEAFAAPLELNKQALQMMTSSYAARGRQINAAVKKMAFVPRGARLIPNAVSAAPGFRLHNVFVLAGVPKIFAAMLDELGPELDTGHVLHATTVIVLAGESRIAAKLTELQQSSANLEIGSYPQQGPDGRYFVKVVWRSYDQSEIDTAVTQFKDWLRDVDILTKDQE